MGKRVEKNSKHRSLKWCIAVCAVALTVVLAWLLVHGGEKPPVQPDDDSSAVQPTGKTELPADIGSGLTVIHIGPYTGMYMEDGSNEIVSDVLMCIVRNDGDKAVEYAELKLSDGQKEIPFTLTALLPGRSVVLLATDRTAYDAKMSYGVQNAAKVAFFAYEPSLQADRIQIQGLNGGMNVTNISGSDITGDVVIYYKNVASDGLLYGGITYRARISGGIKAGELKQGMTEHFRVSGSEVLFVTVAE